ncbi:MAG: 50S ribosomal protein L29 [Nanoarchaeota archaeon]|nr:50S ribosomal protein L29 [Nanoarchaeota archaeon]MBU1321356.1 50S ribosomal protein L29 [Nanoarchaeota archaeon]MBU1597348.1 50S ribosomal protein L29 [Nanoarchaeota archaeon]MBU2441263.1 50S ribosomal protein L29 [Nanoarchaeota archaeon]
MKFKELAQMRKEERSIKIDELRLELMKLNSQVVTGTPPKNAGQIKRLKKDIAKLMLLNHMDKKVETQKPIKTVVESKSEPKSQSKVSETENLNEKTNKKQLEKKTEKTK